MTAELRVTIGRLRQVLTLGVQALVQYDRFLRDRTIAEWLHDHSVFQLLDHTAEANAEAAEFWSRLLEPEKRTVVGTWLQLAKEGQGLLAPNRDGGVGDGFGPSETAPPGRARHVLDWGERVQAFLGQFEKLRAQKRLEARTDPGWEPFKSLRSTGVWILVGVFLLAAVSILSRGSKS